MQKSKFFQVNFMVLLNEELRANILALALISAMKKPKEIPIVSLAKEIISKMKGNNNFTKKGTPIYANGLNQDNLVNKVLEIANLTNNQRALNIMNIVNAEINGIDANKKFGLQNSVETYFDY